MWAMRRVMKGASGWAVSPLPGRWLLVGVVALPEPRLLCSVPRVSLRLWMTPLSPLPPPPLVPVRRILSSKKGHARSRQGVRAAAERRADIPTGSALRMGALLGRSGLAVTTGGGGVGLMRVSWYVMCSDSTSGARDTSDAPASAVAVVAIASSVACRHSAGEGLRVRSCTHRTMARLCEL